MESQIANNLKKSNNLKQQAREKEKKIAQNNNKLRQNNKIYSSILSKVEQNSQKVGKLNKLEKKNNFAKNIKKIADNNNKISVKIPNLGKKLNQLSIPTPTTTKPQETYSLRVSRDGGLYYR